MSHGGEDIKGVFVVRKSACVCGIAAPPPRLAAAHFVAALFGLKRTVRGVDAIIKLTHGRDGTHCPRTAALPPPRDVKCPHLRHNGENKILSGWHL